MIKRFTFAIVCLIFFSIVGTIESTDAPTEQDIMDYIIKCDIQHPEIVMKQAKLETGYFTSPIYKNQNNLFGLKYAYIRPCTAHDMNKKNRSAIYHNWKLSIIDYMLFQKKYYNGTENYYRFLDRVYAEDTLYTKKLRGVK